MSTPAGHEWPVGSHSGGCLLAAADDEMDGFPIVIHDQHTPHRIAQFIQSASKRRRSIGLTR